jgi:hypothetical protein
MVSSRACFFTVDQLYGFRKAQTSTFYLFVDVSNPSWCANDGLRSCSRGWKRHTNGIAAFRTFVAGLRRDEVAVQAALELLWSQDPDQYHVHDHHSLVAAVGMSAVSLASAGLLRFLNENICNVFQVSCIGQIHSGYNRMWMRLYEPDSLGKLFR